MNILFNNGQHSTCRLVLGCFAIGLVGSFQPARAQVSIFQSLSGGWNHLESGHSIEIRTTGDVWTTAGGMARTSVTIQAGGNFAFEGSDGKGSVWRCVYYVTLLGNGNRSNWRVVSTSGGVNCPAGVFERVSVVHR